MYLYSIGILLIIYQCDASGFSDWNPGNCSGYLYIGDQDNTIYPGRIKTLVYNLYVPSGLTPNACIHLETPSDISVILSDAYLTFQDANVTMEKAMYSPKMILTSKQLLRVSIRAQFDFGDIICSCNYENSTIEPTVAPILEVDGHCSYCLIKLAVEYLMANIKDVSDNSTRATEATFLSNNKRIDNIISTVVLRPNQNFTNKSNFSMDIADVVEFRAGSVQKFRLQAIFGNPLSSYKLIFNSTDPLLGIASVWVRSAGDHYTDILTKYIRHQDDYLFCEGPQTRIRDFGFVPNKGAYDANSSLSADFVELEVILVLSEEANVSQLYTLDIKFEVDFVETLNITKHFNATTLIPIEKINITSKQSLSMLPKSGRGTVYLTWDIPPLVSGTYKLTYSTKRYAGPGGNGMIITAISIYGIFGSSNLPCVDTSEHWDIVPKYIKRRVSNIHYTNISLSDANAFGYRLMIVMRPDIVEANSCHELTVNVNYQGEGSPQTFKFYFNVTNEEILTTRGIYGELPMRVNLRTTCRSITTSTGVQLILDTHSEKEYGRLFVEMPMAYESGQSFLICVFKKIRSGKNVFGRFTSNITRREDGMVDKVIVDLLPLTNIYLLRVFGNPDNYVSMNMIVTFIDSSMHTSYVSMPFRSRVINGMGTTIWAGELEISKPKIEYYPDFIVVTKIRKPVKINPKNLRYHYSLNGIEYHHEALLWEDGSNTYFFDLPKIIGYFYFSTSPCTVICGVFPVWLPLKHYITIVKDVNNVILRKVPYTLDGDVKTCIDLPVPRDSPSMFWMRINKLSLFGVTSNKFIVHIAGEGIECQRSGQKIILVGTSGPTDDKKCNINTDIVFCKHVSHTTKDTMTHCDIKCECVNFLQCSNVHITMQSTNKDPWHLCEITIKDA